MMNAFLHFSFSVALYRAIFSMNGGFPKPIAIGIAYWIYSFEIILLTSNRKQQNKFAKELC
jgi:hypothetical protein